MNYEPLNTLPETSTQLGDIAPTVTSGGLPPSWNSNTMVPSGYTVVLPLPLGRTPADVPTFIIRTTPTYVLSPDSFIPNTYFQPVQMVAGIKKANTPFKILATPTWNPMTLNSHCHRYVSGSLGVSLRINATGFTGGNLLVTEHNSLHRNFYSSWDSGINTDYSDYLGYSCYPGLTSNSSAPTAFALNDLAIAKNITIKSPNPDTDVRDLHLYRRMTAVGSTYYADAVSELYSESCLGVKIQTDLVSLEPGFLSIDVYFDWSAIRWDYPMYPIDTLPDIYSYTSTDVFDKQYHTYPPNQMDKDLMSKLGHFSIKEFNENEKAQSKE